LNKGNFKAHLALLAANLIYGINHIVAKGVMPDKIGPSAFVFIRILLGGILFWIIKSFIKEKVAKKDLVLLLFCGLFGVATNMLLFFHGLNLTSPIDASIIMTTGPVMVFIFSFFMLKEKVTSLKMLGIGFGAFGSILLISYGERAGGTSSVLGNLFVFINACSFAFYLVLVKPLMKKYNPITIVSWVFLFGFLWMFPFGISDAITTDYSAFTTHTYLTVGFVVVGTTFLTYLFNVYALSKVSPTVIGSYIYSQPVISFILVSLYGVLFHVDKYANDIDVVKVISCILVAAGVYLISRRA
jgi:drug/metabolite transporter (DMT)-like permease